MTPTYLYHGSQKASLQILRPAASSLFKRKVVFASADLSFALAMIYGNDQELAIGYYQDLSNNSQVMYITELQPTKLQLLNQSGFVYIVDSGGFKTQAALAKSEYISFKPVTILKELYFDNILDYLRSSAVYISNYQAES